MEQEICVQLLNEEGSPLPNSVSRRALRLVPTRGGYNVTNVSEKPLPFSMGGKDESKLNPVEPLFIDNNDDLRNIRIGIGPFFEIATQSVGGSGNETRIQTLIFRRTS